MSEYTMETRHRSRSKTPFLRSSCDHENCDHVGDEPHTHHHKKQKSTSQASNVRTIIEETVEVTSSSSIMGSGKDSPSKMTQTKIKTSDYSSEDSPENKTKTATRGITSISAGGHNLQTQQQNQKFTETKTTSTVVTKTKKSGGSVATSTPKTSNFVTNFASQYASRGGGGGSSAKASKSQTESHYEQRSVKEHTQNVLNSEKEMSKGKSYLSGFLGNSFGADNLDSSDHVAYLEYKKAGEYWKTTPKTDYTYSELSPHRRELAPGIVAMPNMSRKSLENHHERINYMVERDPAQEEYIRRRYEASKFTQNRRAAENLSYESGDEVDYAYRRATNVYNNRYDGQQQSDSWLMRFITTIVTTVTSTWSSMTGSNSDQNGGVGRYTSYSSSMYHTKVAEQDRGFFGSMFHGIASGFAYLVRNLYLFISSVLCLDTWLLQSSNADNKSKKRFLLFLLMLLPLLLLAAWWLLDEQDRLLYMQRWQSLLPLSLITTLRSSLYTNVHSLKSLLQLPLFASTSSSQNLDNLKLSMQKSMPAEEYENILNHINSYVQTLVDLKLQEQQQRNQGKASELSTKQITLIVQIIKENLEALSRQKRFTESPETLTQLSEADLNLIIQKVLLRLQEDDTLRQPLILTAENKEEIKRLIAQTLQVNNYSYYNTIVENLDLDALIARLLKAPLFTAYINEEISSQINGKLHEKLLQLQKSHTSTMGADQFAFLEQQKLIIDNLGQEISFIKLSLNDKVSENEDLHYSIKHLQQTQDDLLRRLQELEFSNDERFSNLMQEITLKLNTLKDEQFHLLNQQVKLSLIDILGFRTTSKDGAKFDDADLQNWINSMFVAKDYLEQRLALINNRTNERIKQEIDKSAMFLMRDISERLKTEIILAVKKKHLESNAVLEGHIKAALSEEEVRNIVKSVLAIYDADKTGLVDFALESAGGQILSTRCTESYQTKSAQISVFGIPLWYPTNTPRVAISPNVQPGECWAFQGFPGFLVLKLNSLVYVTGFTLEHIPKSLAPNGAIDSAPKNFTVWGLEHEKDQEPVLFGEYEYADNDASLQYFPVQNQNINRPYEIVELRIESNHGQPLYTCLYRFRVHGKPPTT
ncbi:klaroid protein isoform X1 [Stomoxys calcitrans]|uniref:klaroid protein isoform X1 n=1 Tax=Stomoxys calcitrans TaxID=35570 RepID=UPI0027E399A2|nr:klaroid protein isoform X1 [Stomoxys calcitrans]